MEAVCHDGGVTYGEFEFQHQLAECPEQLAALYLEFLSHFPRVEVARSSLKGTELYI